MVRYVLLSSHVFLLNQKGGNNYTFEGRNMSETELQVNFIVNFHMPFVMITIAFYKSGHIWFCLHYSSNLWSKCGLVKMSVI